MNGFVRRGSATIATFGVLSFASIASAQDEPPATPPAETTPSPYGEMQTGGLTPPPPMSESTAHGSTEHELDDAKKNDGKRGLSWVWIEASGGFEHVGLETFSAKQLASGLVPTTASGGMVSGALGLRLIFLTIGARARIGFFSPWQLFTLGGELGIHIPFGKIEPHFDAGFGYAGIGDAGGAIADAPGAVSIRGFYARVGAGVDYYVAPAFSIGLNGSFELLGLTRPGVDASTIQTLEAHKDVSATEAAALSLDGSSYGSALSVTGVLALHF